MKKFRRVKTASAYITIVKNGFAIQLDAEGMGSIINHLKVFSFCNFINSDNVAGITVNMRCKNGASIRLYGCLYFRGVDVASEGINVYKYWLTTFPNDTAGRGYVRKRCRYYFAG